MKEGKELYKKAELPAGAHVAWCRYVTKHERPTRIVLCDSDAEGAFPVFRHLELSQIATAKTARELELEAGSF